MFNPGARTARGPAVVVVVSPSERANAVANARVLAIAGAFLAAAGFVILMGIITAEALYPATYTTFENEISDLGATRPPDSIIRQPSARIFNATMLISGALVLAAAAGTYRALPQRRVAIWLMLISIGLLGVGLFPGNRAPMHGIFALLAFISGGGGAIASGTVARGPFRSAAIALGVISLGSLLTAMLGDLTPAMDELGDGGVERWVAYPTVVWLALFGGYLMNRQEA